jgi:L-rhamnose 1-dehydrogenase
MTGLLTGKVCAITGGATGIGRAIALEFVKQGASVGVNHLGDPTSEKHMQTLQSQVPQGRIIGSVGDIGKRETGQRLVEDTVKAFGKLDIFVANAGLAAFADFLT